MTSNISKLDYFEGFWLKIQKLKIFMKKPKNHIFRGPKLKNFPFFLFSSKLISFPSQERFSLNEGVQKQIPHIYVGDPLSQNQYFPTTGTGGNKNDLKFLVKIKFGFIKILGKISMSKSVFGPKICMVKKMLLQNDFAMLQCCKMSLTRSAMAS